MDRNDQLLLVKKFPLVVPQNSEFTLYRGFIQVGVSVECENIKTSCHPYQHNCSRGVNTE
jgi:hypothetical protein